MEIITSRINNDLSLDQLVRTRNQKTISALQEKGFVYLSSYSEDQFPFSLLFLTPIFWMMRSKREVTRMSSPLRVTTYYPLLVHRETASIALVNGLHSKFYTQFGDGTVIITVNAGTKTLFDTEKRIYKASFPGTEAQTWKKHQEWRAEFLKAGKEVKKNQLNSMIIGTCRSGRIKRSKRMCSCWLRPGYRSSWSLEACLAACYSGS